MELEKDSTPPRTAALRPPAPRKADDEGLAEEILRVVTAVAEGDLGQRVALPVDGPRGQRGADRTKSALPRIGGMVNAMIEALERKAAVERPSVQSSHKLELLASISHELVPPLHSLLSRAKLLSEDPDQTLNDKQIEHAHTICSSGGDLLALVNEIVDLSRIDAGDISVAPRDVRLSEIIDLVDRSFRPLAERKQLTYTTEVRVGLPARIHTDPRRLQEVLGDLVANALALTEHGSITLRIHRPCPGTRFSNAALEQHDDVIAFSVLGAQIDRGAGGPSPALSVSRQIARLLGGEIRVESDLDRGNDLTLYLPERHPSAEVFAPRAPASQPALQPVEAPAPCGKVLVIDDDVRSTFAVTSVLEAHGHPVVYADDLQGGIDAVLREPDVQIVLFDPKTSGTNGYASLGALRAMAAFEGKAILAVGYPLATPITPEALAQHRAKCLEAGAADYLPKPIDTDDLLALIRHRLTGPGP